jgi:molybdate/tungstate transport system substrate-binding protein
MNAASITRPLHAVLDSFAAGTGARYALQPGASLELARLITETGRRPDVLILADPDVFPKFLEPQFVTRYEIIARNRIVLAYTPQSRGAAGITADNWMSVITQPGVQVGRADPNTDPSGYRTLLAMQLAERHYRQKGLYARLLAAAPDRNVRPREADQVALLQTHALDYIWTYENLAEESGLQYVKLPDEIDLGTAADSALYAQVSVRVLGKKPGDTLTVRGAPILFGAAVLATAPHPALAQRFLAYLMSPDGLRIARAGHFDVLDQPLVVDSTAGAKDPPAPALGGSEPAAHVASIELHGLDGRTRVLSMAALDSLPRRSVRASAHGQIGTFSGPTLDDVMKLVGAPSADSLRGKRLSLYVLAEAADGYRVVFSLAELDPGITDRAYIVADRKDGKPIPAPEGPFRIVVPGDTRPARWAREIVRLSLEQP